VVPFGFLNTVTELALMSGSGATTGSRTTEGLTVGAAAEVDVVGAVAEVDVAPEAVAVTGSRTGTTRMTIGRMSAPNPEGRCARKAEADVA
tara:strand:+ start:3791 stop:4063 length:273 start_codon:yes stop_codon:yes gene_type:complete